MTSEEIQKAITEGIQGAFKNPELHCRYRITGQQHDEDHLFIRQFIVNMGKVSDIKFFVLRWLVVALEHFHLRVPLLTNALSVNILVLC